MKKLAKVFMLFSLFNFIFGLGIMGYASYSVIGSSFKDANIGITDLLKPHLPPDKYSKLEKEMNDNAEKKGTQFAKKLQAAIIKLVPSPNFDYSKVPAAPYPYSDPTPLIQEATKKGLQQGMDALKQMDKNTEATKKQSLGQ